MQTHLVSANQTPKVVPVQIIGLTSLLGEHLECVEHRVYRPLLAEQVHSAGAVGQSGEDLQAALLDDGAADELSWTKHTVRWVQFLIHHPSIHKFIQPIHHRSNWLTSSKLN